MASQMQVAIDCRDPGRLAAFWREVLACRLQMPPSDDERDYYAVMQDPEGNEFCIG